MKKIKENNWINIGDELPKVDQKVLVFIESNNKKWSDIRIDSIYIKKENKYWNNFNGFMTNAEITYWMPLPLPPKKNIEVS